MLAKEKNNIDACSISTPDNTHAVATLAAMQLGKHVYTQKPLTHDIYEARILTEAAKKYKVVTQMGNQGGSGDGVRKTKEMYDAGMIGDVMKPMPGQTGRYGRRVFPHQPENLIYQKNWIGIYGLDLQTY